MWDGEEVVVCMYWHEKFHPFPLSRHPVIRLSPGTQSLGLGKMFTLGFVLKMGSVCSGEEGRVHSGIWLG